MTNTGVLPFVRGIDLTSNDFQDNKLPDAVGHMTGLRWMKLNETHLSAIPEVLSNLQKLEHLSLVRNSVENLFGEVTDLHCLRTLNVRRNHIKSSGVPPEVFQLEDLTTLDLSHNRLKDVPEGLEKAKSLLVANLSNNGLESVPSQVFVNLTDLLYLDLSNNKIENLPPQTRRLVHLQTLNLNHNPLGHCQLRQIPSMVSLKELHLRDTQRGMSSMPNNLENLVNLIEIDLSMNSLQRIPDSLFMLTSLKRVDLSDNSITEVSNAIETLQKLECLNLSRNSISVLPASLCKLIMLRRLIVNDNKLDFDGIPSGIGKLSCLEIFSAASNKLEMIPEGLCRCGSLKKLILNDNCLLTLPDAIHLLSDLETLELSGNPDLIIPPKPAEMNPAQKGAGLQFYNIDFSLQHQLRLAGAILPNSQPNNVPVKDPLARHLRLRRGRKDVSTTAEMDQDQAKILKGMKDIADDKSREQALNMEDIKNESLKPKRWDEALEKPPLDYSEFFEDEAGQHCGLTIWEIENFLPNQVEEVAHGKFYEGDCYIVLSTFLDDKESLNWQIFYWIGEHATLDKRACSAIHAVNLRNYLGALCRTVREEQGDESEEFLNLFKHTEVTYISGGRTASGFFTVESVEYSTRLYRVQVKGQMIHLSPCAAEWGSLDPNFVFILDGGLEIFIWQGEKSKNVAKSKARLMSEKINRNERKNNATITNIQQGGETEEFLKLLGQPEGEKPTEPIQAHIDVNWNPPTSLLYQVGLGMGYLELPQVDTSQLPLTNNNLDLVSTNSNVLDYKLLNSKHVYILDCSGEVFLWIGNKSTRLVRAAALKLGQEVFKMITRPSFAQLSRIQEGNETQVFKSKFVGWDDVIAVDFTRTAASVQKTGADLTKWASKQETKVDLSSLFAPRQAPMSSDEANQLIEEWNDDLEAMEAFVLEGKKFVRLPQEEIGYFFSGDCYVFLCRYWVPGESPDPPPGDGTIPNGVEPTMVNGNDKEHSSSTNHNQNNVEDDFQCVVYFWQGRDASNMGWLTFTFSLQKKFESLFSNRLEVVRTHQQQESLKFMSHFKRKMVVKWGKRKKTNQTQPQLVSMDSTETNDNWLGHATTTTGGNDRTEFYHIRSNCSSICTRTIQIQTDASHLNSNFCYILKVPFDQEEDSGLVYVWLGEKSDDDEAKLAQEIAQEMFKGDNFSVQTLNEGEEPENFFWVGLGGSKKYDTNAEYMEHSRLFRCSNEKGYFTVSEKCSDFCQDDLADDDIMILDNGEQVFLWLGARCSEVEIKLALKSAQVYIQHLRVKQPELPRKLLVTLKGKESKRFTKCFHGWSHHKKSPA